MSSFFINNVKTLPTSTGNTLITSNNVDTFLDTLATSTNSDVSVLLEQIKKLEQGIKLQNEIISVLDKNIFKLEQMDKEVRQNVELKRVDPHVFKRIDYLNKIKTLEEHMQTQNEKIKISTEKAKKLESMYYDKFGWNYFPVNFEILDIDFYDTDKNKFASFANNELINLKFINTITTVLCSNTDLINSVCALKRQYVSQTLDSFDEFLKYKSENSQCLNTIVLKYANSYQICDILCKYTNYKSIFINEEEYYKLYPILHEHCIKHNIYVGVYLK